MIMTHEQIEEYLKDRNLDWQRYQLALDSMAYAEQKVIDKACEWLEEKNKMCMYELEMILGGKFIDDFKRYLEE